MTTKKETKLMQWGRPCYDVDDVVAKIKSGAKAIQLAHRIDPYATEAVSFERAAGDKIANLFIKDEGVEKICKALKDNKSLKALDLSANRIGSSGIKALCTMLKSNSTLETLFLEDNKISDEDCEEIASMLSKNTTLLRLSLSGNFITSTGAKALAHSLRKNSSLISLWLNRNGIRDGGAKEFGAALKTNHTLRLLALEDNKVRERGAKVLAKGLRKNTELQILNLGNNKIGAEGAEYFEKAITKGNVGKLEKLVLGGNRFNLDDMVQLEGELSGKGIKLQERSYYDQYGNEIEHNRKQGSFTRMKNFLRYHTKPKYMKQGHFDEMAEIPREL